MRGFVLLVPVRVSMEWVLCEKGYTGAGGREGGRAHVEWVGEDKEKSVCCDYVDGKGSVRLLRPRRPETKRRKATHLPRPQRPLIPLQHPLQHAGSKHSVSDADAAGQRAGRGARRRGGRDCRGDRYCAARGRGGGGVGRGEEEEEEEVGGKTEENEWNGQRSNM